MKTKVESGLCGPALDSDKSAGGDFGGRGSSAVGRAQMPKRSRSSEKDLGATRKVTIKSGFEKGKERLQTRLATPGGKNIAWMNDPCSKCSGDEVFW